MLNRTALTLLILLMPTIARSADAPPGAALIWTSNDPLIVRAREMIVAGQFSQAEALLRQAPASTTVAESIETISRIRQDYSLSAAEMLKKLTPSVRDLTAADVERWTKSRELQSRMIDGQLAY